MDLLEDKNIMLLAPYFFGYEQKMKSAFEKLGANVFLFNERSIEKPFQLAVFKPFPFLFSHRNNRYFRKILEETKKIRFDYVLVVKCDMLSKTLLREIKIMHPEAKMCLYLYDSLKNIKGIKRKLRFFDKASSFDREDCEAEERLHFRPLFYCEDYEKSSADIEKHHDLLFCGTTHSDRYFIVSEIVKQMTSLNLSFYRFLYLQSKFMFLFYKVFGKGFKKAKMEEFSFEKSNSKEIASLVRRANVILDVQHPKQSGLTMRTIEMVGMQKKFITTNEDVKRYDFYNPNNIMIIDRKKPLIRKEFFDSAYIPIDNKTYKKYSICGWALDVLGVTNNEDFSNRG